MEKPKFSLMTVFWIVLFVSSFFAGRASIVPQLNQFKNKTEEALAQASRSKARTQSLTHTQNSLRGFISLLTKMKDVHVMTGRAVELVGNNRFLFEEYDESGNTLSSRTVKLAGIAASKDEATAKRANKLLERLLLVDDPYIVVFCDLSERDSKALSAIVATQCAYMGYQYVCPQSELLSRSLVGVDDNEPILGQILHLPLSQMPVSTRIAPTP